MTNAAKSLLLICAASALELGACSKPQAAADAGNTADASAATPMTSDNTGTMSADNSAAPANDAASNTSQ